ncbi:hypothetical protein C816_02734 [Oscillibacter sp. 1-3]|nr:hypothetical protein C816_02734 [Oscillibacter sp. 1-3]
MAAASFRETEAAAACKVSEYRLKPLKQAEAVIGAYQKIEETAVGGYKKIERKFVDTFLEKAEDSGRNGEVPPNSED